MSDTSKQVTTRVVSAVAPWSRRTAALGGLALALSVLACADTGTAPSEPAVQPRAAEHPAGTVPIHGRISGYFGIAALERCSPEIPTGVEVLAAGGNLSHLGRVQFHASHCTTDFFGQLPIPNTDGIGSFVAANGDVLEWIYWGSQTTVVDLETGELGFEMELEFTGGTGRFTEASGSMWLRGGIANVYTGAFSFEVDGFIGYGRR